MNKILIALAFAIVSAPALAAGSLRFNVNGMVCAFCAQGIEKRIGKMGATQAVFVDLKKKFVIVEPRDGQTLDSKAITAEIVDAGYTVTGTEALSQSVAELRAAAKDKP